MAYFNKIGLLVLSEDGDKFMVCEKNNFTSDFIMPGGQLDEGENDINCLSREIKEELNVNLDLNSLIFINEYNDIASGDLTKDVSIRLYQGKILGIPKPSSEIINYYWIGKEDIGNKRVSPIIRNKIIPDIVKKNIIK